MPLHPKIGFRWEFDSLNGEQYQWDPKDTWVITREWDRSVLERAIHYNIHCILVNQIS